MIEILKELLKVEPELEKLAVMTEEELHQSLNVLLENIPLPDYADEMIELSKEAKVISKNKTLKNTQKRLKEIRIALSDYHTDLGKDEELRLYKKLSAFLCERLSDIIRREFTDNETRAKKLKMVDKALESIELISKVIPKFEQGIVHEDVEDIDMGMTVVDKAAGSPQKGLLDKLSSDNMDNWDRKSPGIFIPKE